MKELVNEQVKKFEHFVEGWLNGWNNHDIEAIMEHYAEYVVVRSPFLALAVPGSSGVVHDKKLLREVYSKSFLKYPDLKFEVIHHLASTESVVIYYRSVENLLAAETFLMDGEGRARMVLCHYRSAD